MSKSNTNKYTNKPSAIILCKVATGISTVRGISAGCDDVHSVIFDPSEPVNYSKYGKKIHLSDIDNNEEDLVEWLINYARKLDNHPVIIPTSDKHALMLAKHYKKLSRYCRIWNNDYKNLSRIISKDGLYNLAQSVNIDVIPAINEPDYHQLESWCQQHSGPYLLKPFYEGISNCNLQAKNLTIHDRESLLEYANNNGTKSLIIQRLMKGGDGFIYDTYGLCGANKKLLTIATHRRLRQMPADTGTTTYGEIPASLNKKDTATLYKNTARLLEVAKYHGIFGIEWLQDRKTGKFYLIDFNARPFTSIGHLTSCGLNLPLFAYEELSYKNSSTPIIDSEPKLKHKYWIDLLRDMETFSYKRHHNELSWLEWITTIFKCRSFAYWNWKDPMPGIYRILMIFSRIIKYSIKKLSIFSVKPDY